MRGYGKRSFVIRLLVLAIFGMLLLSGCEGSDAKKAVQNTVDQAVGVEVAKQGKAVKQEVNQIMNQKMEQNRKDLEKGTTGDESEAPEKNPPEQSGADKK